MLDGYDGKKKIENLEGVKKEKGVSWQEIGRRNVERKSKLQSFKVLLSLTDDEPLLLP